MGLARDVDNFIKITGQKVFIEAEGKPEVIKNFISDYNSKYSPGISVNTDGIIRLQEDANKWGLELRLYLHDKAGAPLGVSITHNDQYRGDYSYRINNVNLIRELFNMGYRIGIN